MSWENDEHPHHESIAERKEKAANLIGKITKQLGRPPEPAVGKGTKIATTFWGQAWNRNLEQYEVYASRLKRGRSYVKNGFVMDLQVEKGAISALVYGSSLYEVTINVRPLDADRWAELKNTCSGEVSSLVGLLQGKLPPAVMSAVTRTGTGLFPEPEDIKFICSCPDYAEPCEHAAAAAYGVGVRFDEQPELLFLLCGVDHLELIEGASEAFASHADAGTSSNSESDSMGDLSSIFGIELESIEETKVEVETEPEPEAAAKKRPSHTVQSQKMVKASKKKKMTPNSTG